MPGLKQTHLALSSVTLLRLARTVLVILLAAVDKSSTRKGVIRRDAARGDWEGMLRAGQSGSRETGAGQGDQTSGAAPIDALPQASFSIS